MSGVNSRAPELGAQEDMKNAKTCLAVLFMHAAGQEALQALAAPLGWSELCEYDEVQKAKDLLNDVWHAHGEEVSTVLNEDEVIALYRSIHDTRQWRIDPSDGSFVEGLYIEMRRRDWRQATLKR